MAFVSGIPFVAAEPEGGFSGREGGIAGKVRRVAPVLHVSPAGNDANDGSSGRPLATLAAAAKRAHVLAQSASGPVVVGVHGGLYRFAATWELTAEESGTEKAPVVFTAMGGKTPVLTGAEELKGLQWQNAGNGMWKAKVPAGTGADQLLVNGEPQTMARFPNAGGGYMGGLAKWDEVQRLSIQWAGGCQGAYLHGPHKLNWGSSHSQVTGVDAAAGRWLTRGGWQVNQRPGHGDSVFIEGALGALDVPGEWFLDRDAGVLWFMPPAGQAPSASTFEIVRVPSLVRIAGSAGGVAHDIHFHGLAFRHTARTFMDTKEPLLRGDWCIARQAAVLVGNAERISVSGCDFSELGGNAVFVSGYARKVDVMANEFRGIGASAVCLVGDPSSVRCPSYWNRHIADPADLAPGPQGRDYPADCLVADNFMHDFGRMEKQSAGVLVSMSERIGVVHNTICLAPRAGICINDGTFGGHLISGNDVFATVRETGDHGPFNSWGRDRHWIGSGVDGAQVKARSRLDNHLPTTIDHNRFSHWGGHSWGIDLDDGSSNYILTRNLCLGCAIKLREGCFRTVENNIAISPEAPGKHCCYAENGDVIRRNIFVNVKTNQALAMILARPSQSREIDSNLYFNTTGLAPVFDSDSSKDAGFGKAMSFADWQAKGLDLKSVFADPQFVDPARDDFRVKPGSPALKLGFKNFPTADFGTRAAALRTKAEAVRKREDKAHPEIVRCLTEPVGKSAAGGKADDATLRWHGADLSPLVGMPLLSAVGLSKEEGAYVSAVEKDSRADKAGLRSGDVILMADGAAVKSPADLKGKDGARIRLDLWRAQKAKSVTLETRKD